MKGIKIRLELNNKQVTLAMKHCGVARHAWNWGISICKTSMDNKTKIPSSIDLHKLLVKEVKSQNPWYYEVSKYTSQQSLRNVETSFKRFFKKTSKFPNYKKKGIKDSFYLESDKIKIKGNKIKLLKFGWVRLSEDIGNLNIKNCVVNRKSNEWFISFKIPFEPTKTNKQHESVGVDLGIKTLVTLSNGETIKNTKPYKTNKQKLRKQQKELSRRFVKGAKNQSQNYKKSKQKLSKIHQRIGNIRKDTLHKVTTYLTKNFETVVVEDLKVSNMVKNHKLSSAILDGGFYEFKRQILYKKKWYGGKVILANTFYPSSKLCSCCGHKKKELKLSERIYHCESCGTKLDRDLNASFNLNKLAVSSTVLAFGDESSIGQNPIQFVDELGIKHQIYTFE